MIIKKSVYITVGLTSVMIGIAGIFIPLLPTTPFLLLAAWFFSRSSEKFHHWLLNHRLCGKYIRNYREKKGMALKHKVRSLLLLWVGIGYSFFFVMNDLPPEKLLYIRIFLVAVLCGVTAHIVMLKTVKSDG